MDAEGDEDTEVKDDSGVEQEGEQPELRQEESGEVRVRRSNGSATARSRPTARRLPASAGRCPAALPQRRSFRSVRTNSRGKLDLRRALRSIVRADGDVPAPPLRRRPTVSRRLLILIDISGSMKLHTGDYLKLAHTAVQAADRVEVFTLGTRLTRITRALKVRDLDAALERVAALVDDWDGGTRIGPTLLAFLGVPRFAAFARGAAIVLLSDGLERGDHAEMETAMRRLGARAFRLSLCTPLAGDPRFSPADGGAEGGPALPRRPGRRLVADRPCRFHADARPAGTLGRGDLEEDSLMQKAIDSHFHIWRQKDQPWLVGPMVPRIFGPYEPIRRDYPIEEFLADQKGSGVEKARLCPDQLGEGGFREGGRLPDRHREGERLAACDRRLCRHDCGRRQAADRPAEEISAAARRAHAASLARDAGLPLRQIRRPGDRPHGEEERRAAEGLRPLLRPAAFPGADEGRAANSSARIPRPISSSPIPAC